MEVPSKAAAIVSIRWTPRASKTSIEEVRSKSEVELRTTIRFCCALLCTKGEERWIPLKQSARVRGRVGGFGRPRVRNRYGVGRYAQ